MEEDVRWLKSKDPHPRKKPQREPVEFSVASGGAGGAALDWQERYEVLLDTAKALCERHPEAAIFMAQAAGEVCTELVLTSALRARVSDQAVADFIAEQPRNYSLGDGRVKELYELLFGDKITASGQLWQDFKAHVERRNKIVHRGKSATRQEADASIAAVEGVIRHLLQNRT